MGPPSEKGGIPLLARSQTLARRASMGPPSEKGGIRRSDRGLSMQTLLQWGRPPRRAESPPKVGPKVLCSGFNGAALREGRNR